MRTIPFLGLLAVLGGCAMDTDGGASEDAAAVPQAVKPEVKPTGRGIGVAQSAGNRLRLPRNIIAYHGGPVMLGETRIYYIWYGDWSGNDAVDILTDLANSIGGSPYFNINTTYYMDTGTPEYVSNEVVLGGTHTVGYPYGRRLTDLQIARVVADALSDNSLPLDPNGVYFVLTSADVTAAGTVTR